jgi:hypothetical protein
VISFPAFSSRKLRTLVVTGGDEGYFSLLDGLIDSLHQWDDDPSADLACFDFGLEPRSRASVAARVSRMVEPGWDLPVDPELCRCLGAKTICARMAGGRGPQGETNSL